MSQQTVKQDKRAVSRSQIPTSAEVATAHRDVPYLLSQMTFEERVRAYATRVFSPRELSTAAARFPDRMPILNGEFEHLVVFSPDYLD